MVLELPTTHRKCEQSADHDRPFHAYPLALKSIAPSLYNIHALNNYQKVPIPN